MLQSNPMETESPSLEVPGEPGVYWCAKHRKVKTRLRCGRCERPICIKCTVYGPTGARCPDCASNRSAHIYQVAPLQYLLAFVAATVAGCIGGAIASMVGSMALWLALYAPAIGPVLGKLVTTITRGKRGPKLAAVVSVGLVTGGLIALLLSVAVNMAVPADMPDMPAMPHGKVAPHPSFGVLLLSAAVGHPFLWVYLVLAIIGVWWWLK